MEREENSRYVVISYVCATVITTVLYLIAGHYFKFYYDLNDDILIKDILSGAYTGTPEAHNIQMLYPLAWIFKMLYGINPSIPWFGMIEVGFMWLCMILMLGRTQLILMNNLPFFVQDVDGNSWFCLGFFEKAKKTVFVMVNCADLKGKSVFSFFEKAAVSPPPAKIMEWRDNWHILYVPRMTQAYSQHDRIHRIVSEEGKNE